MAALGNTLCKARILVVEDEVIVARDLTRQLGMLGYDPIGSTSRGEEALILVESRRPDLVLMDIQLDGRLDGIATATQVRARFGCPVVFLTAFANDETLERAKQAEPFGYIVKPFDERELYSTIEIALHKHRAETGLRRSQQQLATIIQTAMDGFWLCQMDGTITDANDAACSMLGYTRDEFIGRTIFEIEANQQPEEIRARIAQLVRDRGSLRFETRHRHKDGHVLDIEISVNALPAETQRLVAFLRDITARKQAESLLRASEAKFATIFRCAPLMISISELADGTYLDANDEFLRVTGYAREEVIGHTSIELGFMPPEIRARVAEHLRRDGRLVGFQLQIPSKQGQRVDCLINADLVEIDGRRLVLINALDITEHKRMETQLRQAQKMDAFGQLAGGVAHDFNNILVAITLHVGILRQSAQLDPETKASLRELEQVAARGAALTRQLTAFSRQRTLEMRPLDLNETVENVLKMLRRVLGERIAVEWTPAPQLPLIDGDVGTLEQVLMNLCVNARDAMPEGGRLAISTSPRPHYTPPANAPADARAGDFLCLSVADSGQGMGQATLARIFEPFFTTKDVGKGTGLGLSIVHGIVRQHGGWIEVESRIGHGSTFHLFIPPSTTPPAPAAPATADDAPRGSNELILAVEDEETVRAVLAATLSRHGYRVVTANNGHEALVAWQSHREECALLITDMVLPGGMGGIEIIERVREDRPQIPIIVASGYLAGRESRIPSGVVTLAKPFDAQALLGTIHRLLCRS